MNAIAIVPITDDEPLESLADSLLSEHRVTQKALPSMLAKVMADEDLRHEVMVRLIESECRRVLDVRMNFRHQQIKRRTGGGPVGAARSSDMSAWAGAVAESLMDDFRLPNGRKLGDATRDDLRMALAGYQTTADDALVKVRWLRLVQQSTPHGKTVRQALTDERVKELREEARKAEQ